VNQDASLPDGARVQGGAADRAARHRRLVHQRRGWSRSVSTSRCGPALGWIAGDQPGPAASKHGPRRMVPTSSTPPTGSAGPLPLGRADLLRIRLPPTCPASTRTWAPSSSCTRPPIRRSSGAGRRPSTPGAERGAGRGDRPARRPGRADRGTPWRFDARGRLLALMTAQPAGRDRGPPGTAPGGRADPVRPVRGTTCPGPRPASCSWAAITGFSDGSPGWRRNGYRGTATHGVARSVLNSGCFARNQRGTPGVGQH